MSTPSTIPEQPGAFQEAIDEAFMEFMIEEGFYLREGTGIITNPAYPYSLQTLQDKWMKKKKDMFGTTSNTEPKGTQSAKTKKTSTR